MTNTEQWITVIKNPNYEVSTLGNVRNKTTKKILKHSVQSAGYDVVNLSNKGNVKQYTVHRLVLESFFPNPDPKKYTDINHIDQNKQNNCLDNLEWCTHRYNVMWSVKTQNSKEIKESILLEINNNINSILDKYIL